MNRLRNARGWTQEKLAEKADLHRRYVQKIEGGEKRPTINTLAKLRSAFDVSWDELLVGIDGNPYPDT